MDESSKHSKKNINIKNDEMNISNTAMTSEESLVKDLEESLKNTVEETLDTLHSLIEIVKTKIDDPLIIVETEKIIESLNKEISNSYIKNFKQHSSVFNETKVSKTSEEE